MNRTPETVGPHDPFTRALRMLGDGDLDQVPAVAGGRLAGFLSRSDVIRVLRIPGCPGEGSTSACPMLGSRPDRLMPRAQQWELRTGKCHA